ncbi:helix-turn-helix domain-containing protein [Pseudomonas paeninsulae]|uniref:helix-turn-helix domain-containing protein n=1 Tax=Pseudomonas paeninsulae TaxID=3110772 RepID=UPI002D797512|nr:helix-turn-helix domain-containing protein [Pseudomonas sp. IT1137]
MTQTTKVDHSASPKKSHINDTSGSAQRLRLLARLKLGPVDTFAAIRELNILRPGARISELRAAGHLIKTRLITLTDDQGRTHDGIALYCLSTEPAGRVAA